MKKVRLDFEETEEFWRAQMRQHHDEPVQALLRLVKTGVIDMAAIEAAVPGAMWSGALSGISSRDIDVDGPHAALLKEIFSFTTHPWKSPGFVAHRLVHLGAADWLRTLLSRPDAPPAAILQSMDADSCPTTSAALLPEVIFNEHDNAPALLELLLDYGMDPNLRTEDGFPLLFLAPTPTQAACLKQYGADISVRTFDDNISAGDWWARTRTSQEAKSMLDWWYKHQPAQGVDEQMASLANSLVLSTKSRWESLRRRLNLKGNEVDSAGRSVLDHVIQGVRRTLDRLDQPKTPASSHTLESNFKNEAITSMVAFLSPLLRADPDKSRAFSLLLRAISTPTAQTAAKSLWTPTLDTSRQEVDQVMSQAALPSGYKTRVRATLAQEVLDAVTPRIKSERRNPAFFKALVPWIQDVSQDFRTDWNARLPHVDYSLIRCASVWLPHIATDPWDVAFGLWSHKWILESSRHVKQFDAWGLPLPESSTGNFTTTIPLRCLLNGTTCPTQKTWKKWKPRLSENGYASLEHEVFFSNMEKRFLQSALAESPTATTAPLRKPRL